LVVDCSALAGVVFRETWEAEARRRLEPCALHAPHLLLAELANVAVKKMRRGESHAEGALALASEMAIQLHRIDPAAVVALAWRYQLSAYDASYLWLATELKCPLVTFDQKLGEAARQHLAGLT
jgi:predicted nucleic acid-binding protein